ncbi:hypothetical protein JCM14244_16910 [Venenivibrio stagnispumantis]|uniref:Site-specific recombinase XerD n=1 Tax=Venenivibrio stagnispumantis TaxID=407998 RepID=A0AA45WQH7_9AQUI|nr:hypothetical protein [Venenivibrio stagnispumantis]MCW4574017.1 hypothetical protein [Venenivibrio stagnispumantis]SMP23409.1 Site-specific recombinase XerD [Venenivibrio stagnispumantis]
MKSNKDVIMLGFERQSKKASGKYYLPAPAISPNSSIKYAIGKAVEFLDRGIGKSRAKFYRDFQTGVSPYWHGYDSRKRYLDAINSFREFCERNNINKIKKLTTEHIDKFFFDKASMYRKSTIKVNAEALKKLFNVVRQDLAEHIQQNYQKYYSAAKEGGRALAYQNPEKLINSLKEDYRPIARLQYYTAARIDDLVKMKIDVENKKVEFYGSKGGKDREINYNDRPDKFEQIKQDYEYLQEKLSDEWAGKNWDKVKDRYYSNLKYHCIKNSEIYSASHGFRVSYAVERFFELKAQGLDDLQADQILTRELGHNRISMSQYYRNG